MRDRMSVSKGTKMSIPVIIRLVFTLFFLTIPTIPTYALTPAQVFDKVKDAIVALKALDAQGKVKSQGSGVLLPSGRVATNCHLLEGGVSYRVGRGGQFAAATLYTKNTDKDICILDAGNVTGKPAHFGKTAGLRVGDPVYAVGTPQGIELALADGIVARLWGTPSPMIQTTADISPGWRGGGLFDGEGRLIGLNTLYREDGKNLSFAMPVEWLSDADAGLKPVARKTTPNGWEQRFFALDNANDWHGMLDWSRKWTESDSENANAWYSLGIAYDKLSRYKDAVKAYNQAHRKDPKRVHIWNNLGVAYDKLGRTDDAIDTYYEALRQDPENADAWYNLGNAYDDLSRYNDAMKAYNQALRKDPKKTSAWYNLGIVYDKLSRYTDAIEAYLQALRIDPKKAGAWNNLGNAYNDLSRYTDAIEAYRQALRIDPDDADIWSSLAISYAHSGNRSAALDALLGLRRLDPERSRKLSSLIGVY